MEKIMEKVTNNQKSLFEDIIEKVIILDKEGRIKEISKSTLTLLGYESKEELLDKSMNRICRNFSFEKIMDKIPLQDCEMVYLDRQKKKIPVSVNITAQRDNHELIKGIIFVARDISKIKDLINELTISREELKSSYAELQSSKNELISSEKLAFTGRIAANIAHEIRNPLTNVIISIQQLKKASKSKFPWIKHIEIIMRNTERINYLITELLNCARPPKLNIRACNVHEVLEGVLDSVKAKIKLQRIKVVKKFTSGLSRIEIDKEQIERAFLNLVLNAVEAMPKKGRLFLVTELKENFFVVKIQDTGKGIFEKDIIKIFDPFFSSKRGGIGLGLAVCYGIIVSHSGTIEVESKPKEGSSFIISLPLSTTQKSGGGGVA